MKIAFLASTRGDLEWFRKYYESVFPEGAASARTRYQRALGNLRANSHIGHPGQEAATRQFSLGGTPFTIIYRIAKNRIEVVRVRDGRANWPQHLPAEEHVFP